MIAPPPCSVALEVFYHETWNCTPSSTDIILYVAVRKLHFNLITPDDMLLHL